ncbi:MAG TPA: GMC family oxidoreductase [Thermoanaerobaculia bacterium]|nr:GMC family oxidoreductase [Thermoanaerobaculia bacterium]
MRDDAGDLLFGPALLHDWRRRATHGAARLRAYYDVLPSPESRLTLDPSRRNEHGDPMLRIDFADAPESAAARPQTEATIRGLFERIVASGGGKLLRVDAGEVHDHPAGGLRMGRDAASGVVDPWGRSFHHDNLWVAGAPTMPSAGCNNGTLTFVALSLRTAGRLAEELPARAADTGNGGSAIAARGETRVRLRAGVPPRAARLRIRGNVRPGAAEGRWFRRAVAGCCEERSLPWPLPGG